MNGSDIFKEEALELLNEVESSILELQKRPGEEELLNKLFRDLHTIKGSGAMFGFDQVAEFTHQLENVIDSVRKGEFVFFPELGEPFLDGRDHILKMIEEHGRDSDQLDKESQKILAEIKSIIAADEDVVEDGGKKVDSAGPTELKILIVEDEFTSRFILQDFLSVYGRSHIAVDGYEAILAVKSSLANRKPYDLVCLDVMMPGIDGIKVSQEIRRLELELGTERPCKIVMVSSINNPEIIDDLLDNKHCDIFLVKPLSISKMAEFIQTIR